MYQLVAGISSKAAKEMKNALKNMNKEEMKEALKKMNKKELKAVLKVMNPDELKEVLGNMSKEDLKAVLNSMNKDELKTVLGNMSSEDLKAVLNSMSKEELKKALENMTEDELREALKNLSKEEIMALKAAGKLDGIKGIDKLLADSSSEDDSDSDGGGKGKRKKKKKRSDSAYSYYSVTSEGGTRYVRRRHRRPDGTYSDSESCPSDAEAKRAGSGKSKKSKKSVSDKNKKGSVGGQGEKDKKGKKKGGKGDKGGEGDEGGEGGKGKKGKKGKGGAGGGGDEDGADSDYSIRSEVSEGGTRRQVKMKRIRDEDGNVVGYGEAVPYDYRAESVAGRRGSMESLTNREGTLEREERRREMQKLEERIMKENQEKEKEAIKKKYQEEKEKANLQRKQEREMARKSLQGKDLINGKQGASGDLDADMEGLLTVRGQGDGGQAGDDVPSDFSDDSLDDEDVDLSKMTEEEREAYLAEREKKRQLQEERRRAKYGDKYDEIMKKKKAKKEQEAKKAAEEQAKLERQEEAQRLASEEERRRRSSVKNAALNLKTKEKPKSMVTYDKGPPRWPQSKETSNLSRDQPENKHERRNSKVFTSEGQRRLSRGGNDDFEGSKFLKLPPINSNKRGSFSSDDGDTKKRGRRMHPRGETIDKNVAKSIAERTVKEKDELYPDDDMIEIDESGKLRIRKGKKLDLSKMSDEMLRKLGIDPNLSNKEKAKLLKKLFGSDIEIQDQGRVIGTKGLDEYDLDEVTDDMLADDPNLDIDTLTGQRRVNVLMRRGGMLLKEHMKKVIDMSKLIDEMAYRTDLDEKGDIDFMHHYRLVDPNRIETYAKAFVVEDGDLDTVINLKEMITALDGVPTMNTMTEKQYDYVFKVLNINDATQVTFRMFAVFTALCERVTCMDNLSKHLLEICNLADIERKLDLYRSMFYHNIQSGYDPNHITADSLKIELIAGGLSWLQQQYVMEKMDMDLAGNISFLDYMCYIPLFMSMHDNIVDNPLDMSDQKYSVPPRTRPASAQRDINPLGFPLSKTSSLQMRQKAKDLQEGRLKPGDVAPDTLEKLHKFSKLPEIKPVKRTSTSTTRTSMSSVEKIDLIF